MRQKGFGPRGTSSAAASWQKLQGKASAQPTDPHAALVQKGVELQRRGQVRAAHDTYQQVLSANPNHPDANHALALLAHEQRADDVAVRLLNRAIAAAPTRAVFRSNLGILLVSLGQLDEAVESYRQALKRDARLPEVECNMGIALLRLGRAVEAGQAQRRALALRPDYPDALANLGRALAAQGRTEDALASFGKALQLRPDYADAHAWRGDLLDAMGQSESAASSYRVAIGLKPDHAGAHFGLAAVLEKAGRLDAAANNYRAAIYVEPSAAAYAGLGRCLAVLGDAGAAEAFRAALRIAPDYPAIGAALARLGDTATGGAPAEPVRAGLSRLEADEARYRIAVEVTPDNPQAHSNLAAALSSLGRLEDARAQYREAIRLKPDHHLARTAYLFITNYLGDLPVAEMVAEAKAYGEVLAAQATARTAHANDRDPGRKLRVGLVSPDLRFHPVAKFLEGPLAEIDRGKLDLYAYSTTNDEDDATARMRALIPDWRDAAYWSDDRLEEAILADRIDILVDLSGHTANNRLPLFARKPAPVAVTWLGYFATTGVAAIDYVLCNRWVVPESEEDQWVERPWRLPDTYLCFGPPKLAVNAAPPPALVNGFVTFGSANNLNKLSDQAAACWADVLGAVPGSKLLLRSAPLDDARVREATAARFAALGIAGDRLILEGSTSDYASHLRQYNRVDIGLDPFPYAGGTTTAEALWMGVPVLTLEGDRYVAHMGESLLHNVGMPEWIAADTADYVRKAAAFASDLPALARLRQDTRHRFLASPLADAPAFARNLETAFRGMWEEWCRGH